MTAYQRLPSASFRSAVDPSFDVEMPHRRRPADSRALILHDLAWIDSRGVAEWDRRRLPDTAHVTAAVSCLARGAMLRGAKGPVAIEDLIPGDYVGSRSGGTVRIDWIGSRTYRGGGDTPKLFRVAAQAFGGQGPEADVVLGADAQILIDSPRCMDLVGTPRAFAPISAFEDGMGVTAIRPQGEVAVYGIACAGQEAVMVSGLAVETYHPSRSITRSLTRVVLTDVARLFPHVAGGSGFGPPRIPYLSLSEARGLSIGGY